MDDFYDFGGYILIGVGGDGNAVIAVTVHLHCGIHCLEEVFRVDAGKDEAAFVKRFGALGGGADAYGGERVPY